MDRGRVDPAAVAFRLDPGATFRATGGNVHVDAIGSVAVTDTVSGFRDERQDDGEPRWIVFQPEWWLEIETAEGRAGWIRMTPEVAVLGADACG